MEMVSSQDTNRMKSFPSHPEQTQSAWCVLLYYTILCYTMLYYTILYYTILYYTILYNPTGDDDGSAIDHVLQSVTRGHAELFVAICSYICDHASIGLNTTVATATTEAQRTVTNNTTTGNALSLSLRGHKRGGGGGGGGRGEGIAAGCSSSSSSSSSEAHTKAIPMAELLARCQSKMIAKDSNDVRSMVC